MLRSTPGVEAIVRTGIRALALGALLSLVVGSCSCEGDPPTSKPKPDPLFSPATFAFDGLCAGDSRRQELLIENKGPGKLVAHVSFEGEGAESYRLEADGEPVEEFSIDGFGERTFEVVFEPRGSAGDKEAWLVVEWGDERQELLLTGRLSANPDEPVLSANWELCESPKNDCAEQELKEGDIIDACCRPPRGVHFGKVWLEQTATVTLKFENRSCGAASITAVDLGPELGECGEGDVTVLFPEEGIELPGSPDASTATIEVQFAPTVACTLNRKLTVHTSDPNQPTFEFEMVGEGVMGDLQLEDPPAAPVHFLKVRKGEYRELPIRLWNSGTRTVVATEAKMLGDHADHFEIVSVAQCGRPVSLPLEIRSWTEVCPSDVPEECEGKPPLCESRLVVNVRYAPKGPGLHGSQNRARLAVYTEGTPVPSASVPLLGESLPVFRAYPSQMIAFGAPSRTNCGGMTHACEGCINGYNPCTQDAECAAGARCVGNICTNTGIDPDTHSEFREAMCATSCGQAERPFLICNEGGFNDLVIDSIRIVAQDGWPGGPVDPGTRNPIFELDTGDCGETLEPNECCQAKILLVDNRGGGENNAILEVVSNLQAEPHRIDIKKNTADIQAPEVESFVVTPTIARVNQAVRVKANVSAQYGGVARYEWRLESPYVNSDLYLGDYDFVVDPANPDRGCKKPGGTGCFQLLDDAGNACLPDGSNCTTLVFYPDIGGPEPWKFTVDVWGDICEPAFQTFKTGTVTVGE